MHSDTIEWQREREMSALTPGRNSCFCLNNSRTTILNLLNGNVVCAPVFSYFKLFVDDGKVVDRVYELVQL